MPIATLSTKGQITLPARLRKRLGLQPHDRVHIESVDDTIVIRRAADLFALEGFLGKALPEAEEREQMMRAAADAARGSAE